MPQFSTLAAALLSLMSLTSMMSGPPEPAAWVGTWSGDIVAGGQEIATIFHLALDDEGQLFGTCDSPDQNVFGLEISAVSFEESGAARFEIAVTGGVFVAALEEGRLVGTWTQRGAELPLALARAEPAYQRVDGQERFVGSWEGRLAAGGARIRLRFNLEEDPTGRLIGTTDSPDQGARGIPISEIVVQPSGEVRIAVAAFGGAYAGTIDASGTKLEGHLDQNGASIPVELERIAAVAPPNRPQTPTPPFPYFSDDVTYENEDAGITLAGTLTIPEGKGPFPAVVLITGSGAQDRDETVFDHKPFLVIADHLTRRGVAVLRVDDRGVGRSESSGSGATSLDFAGDALAGVRFLETRTEIDSFKIGLIGHSEGGMIAPMVAAAEPDDIAFIVLLAGPGVTGERILISQSELITRVEGQDEELIAGNRRTQEKMFAALRENPDATVQELGSLVRAAFEGDPNVPEGEAGEMLVNQQVDIVTSAWMRFFVTFDPRPTLARVKCPVLAVNGEFDLQVPCSENLEAIAKALGDAGHQDFTTHAFPSLNHLFQTCETGALTEYDEIEETFAPAALEVVSEWITERFGASP